MKNQFKTIKELAKKVAETVWAVAPVVEKHLKVISESESRFDITVYFYDEDNHYHVDIRFNGRKVEVNHMREDDGLGGNEYIKFDTDLFDEPMLQALVIKSQDEVNQWISELKQTIK